jgi:serine/threonine protein kinase
MAELIGRKLGQYEIFSLLGEGGMASVYRARQSNMNRDVAIKVIESKLARNPDFVRRFEREAQTVAALSNTHVLKVFDFGEQDGLLYIVMELLHGGSLAARIGGKPLPLETVARLLEQIASALDYAHRRGIIHRDLKPQNVLLDDDGNAVLTDFGIAKLLLSDATSLTQSGTAMGTPTYMSPEQWKGQNIDARSDIYALGIMAFEMLSGEVPFKADTPFAMMHQHVSVPPPSFGKVPPGIPASVEKVIHKALAKNPEDRFQSAGEFATAFRAALSGKTPPGVEIPPHSVSSPSQKITAPYVAESADKSSIIAVQKPRSTGGFVVAAVMLLAVVGGIVLFALNAANNNTSQVTTIGAGQEIGAIPSSSPTTTDQPPSDTPTSEPTEQLPVNLETVVVLTQGSRLTETTVAIASFTKTPTSTATVTPDLNLSAAAVINATDTAIAVTMTANAIASFTKTPTPTDTLTPSNTPTPSATSTSTPTYTPSVTPLPTIAPGTTRIDSFGIMQVYVPAGCFMMGNDLVHDPNARSDEQPAHEVCITHPYWIDMNEVTNASYAAFISAGGYSNRDLWSDAGWNWKGTRGAPNDYDDFTGEQQPRVGLTWYEAEAYANWRGCRLPTEAQWEFAARGPDSLIYPWGDEWNSANANTDRRVGGTANVGSYPDGTSWVGAKDMSGNVWEWVADWYDSDYYTRSPKNDPAGADGGQYRTLRGGSWSYSPTFARTGSRNGGNPVSVLPFIGFRVVCTVHNGDVDSSEFNQDRHRPSS